MKPEFLEAIEQQTANLVWGKQLEAAEGDGRSTHAPSNAESRMTSGASLPSQTSAPGTLQRSEPSIPTSRDDSQVRRSPEPLPRLIYIPRSPSLSTPPSMPNAVLMPQAVCLSQLKPSGTCYLPASSFWNHNLVSWSRQTEISFRADDLLPINWLAQQIIELPFLHGHNWIVVSGFHP